VNSLPTLHKARGSPWKWTATRGYGVGIAYSSLPQYQPIPKPPPIPPPITSNGVSGWQHIARISPGELTELFVSVILVVFGFVMFSFEVILNG